LPDWGGISINVVDEKNVQFRGEYELIRIDKFEPLGRGYGTDPTLGEGLKTWILEPGLYKIVGAGQSYNTLTNFVTVRVLPGEFIRFLLVQENAATMTIVGGGRVNEDGNRSIAGAWRYGIDVGGSVDFNSIIYHDKDSSDGATSVALLLASTLRYQKEKQDWTSRLQLDQGIKFDGINLSRFSSSLDNIRLTSIYTWRFLPWIGPYGRFEAESGIFSSYTRVPTGIDRYFFVLTNQQNELLSIDSVSQNIRTQPSFSPFGFETSIGANMDVLNTRPMEMQILIGFGFSQNSRWGEFVVGDTVLPGTNIAANQEWNRLDSLDEDRVILQRINDATTRPEYGPELGINATFRLGSIATNEAEVRVFAPVTRIRTPDFRFRGTTSWRIWRSITLDFQYEYSLKRPEQILLHENTSRFRILLRFSYTSR
jgi:hypothetical protein